MKIYVLLSLWLLFSFRLHAQPPANTALGGHCPACCDSPQEPRLLRILAPELSAVCPACTLLAVAQCPLTDNDIAAQRSLLRYTLRLPDGTATTRIAPMALTPGGWRFFPARRADGAFIPPGDPAPACAPDAL
jgi:hypothetical protein